MLKTIILSTAYLPPIEYVALLLQNNVQLERQEHFQKQSFRNRAHILSGNGVQALTVPVVNGNKEFPIEEACIDYSTSWQRDHWRSIVSAYNNSPYFLYYEDAIRPFYEQRHTHLTTFNEALLKTILQLLRIDCHWQYTIDYERAPEPDYRKLIHPKRQAEAMYPLRITDSYAQVFEDRFPFTPNLSIIDLLFNEGPQTVSYLQNLHIELQHAC